MSLPKYTPEQEEFFEFVKQQTTDPKEFHKLIQYALFNAHCAFSESPHKLKQRLKEKIIKGSQEYGSPVYPLNRIRKEFLDECIDLIGWLLVEKFNQQRLKKHGEK